jgi:DNA-binding CsgD family transcriptional regulator
VLKGSCDPLSTPRPLGPFRDIAHAVGLGPLVRDEDVRLTQLCEEVFECLGTEPSVLLVEDLHWVDAASVEVLRFLSRRVEAMPLALVVTYRDREVGARHHARPLLGDFARLDGLSTLHLAPLSIDAVADLVADTDLAAETVHRVTRGNPFFVTEVAKEPDRPLPESVRDAVLARTTEVAPEDFEVLQLVATAPDRLDDRVLSQLAVDLPTLRRLDRTGLLARSRGGLVFHHELARQAVESTIPPGGASRLHARLLDALERIAPHEPAVLTHHAVAAQDRSRAASYARAAAEESIHAAAHTEAAAFFQIALEHLDGATPAERADLLQRLSFEQYMTSRLGEAIQNIRATFPLWRQAGDTAGLAGAHETCAIYEYYNARRREAEAQSEMASRIGREDGAEVAYGAARATDGFLAYMRSDATTAADRLAEARRLASDHDQDRLALRAQLFGDLVSLSTGDTEVRGAVADHIELARSASWDELASSGYSHIAYHDVEQRRYRAAELVLDTSLPFAVEREIPICEFWQTGIRSRLRLAQGRWSAALEDAGHVLEVEGMPLARVWPLLVAGLVPLRCGETADVGEASDDPLDRAWELVGHIDEPLRRLAVLTALAERVWMTGAEDPRVVDDAVRELKVLAETPGAEWAQGELATWLRRLGLLDAPPEPVAEPHRLAFAGAHEEAAAWWRQAGEPFAEAMALADSSLPELRVRGVALLDGLGATGTADRLRVLLRNDGIDEVPARPRASTRANPGGLTNRQLDVAKLMARGFTNAEIAARLYISPKTADHHVSAVLTKLGATSRRTVMMRADEYGLA